MGFIDQQLHHRGDPNLRNLIASAFRNNMASNTASRQLVRRAYALRRSCSTHIEAPPQFTSVQRYTQFSIARPASSLAISSRRPGHHGSQPTPIIRPDFGNRRTLFIQTENTPNQDVSAHKPSPPSRRIRIPILTLLPGPKIPTKPPHPPRKLPLLLPRIPVPPLHPRTPAPLPARLLPLQRRRRHLRLLRLRLHHRDQRQLRELGAREARSL